MISHFQPGPENSDSVSRFIGHNSVLLTSSLLVSSSCNAQTFLVMYVSIPTAAVGTHLSLSRTRVPRIPMYCYAISSIRVDQIDVHQDHGRRNRYALQSCCWSLDDIKHVLNCTPYGLEKAAACKKDLPACTPYKPRTTTTALPNTLTLAQQREPLHSHSLVSRRLDSVLRLQQP